VVQVVQEGHDPFVSGGPLLLRHNRQRQVPILAQEQHVTGAHVCCVPAGGDTTVRVWHASDLSLARVLRGHRGSVLSLLAVGNVLLSGSRDNTIRWPTALQGSVHIELAC
jgi:WD40 repeat protein